jgi:hypothetical protein
LIIRELEQNVLELKWIKYVIRSFFPKVFY